LGFPGFQPACLFPYFRCEWTVTPVLLHLRSENPPPDLPRCYAEAERNAILTFLQLLNQFNSDQDLSSMSERFEAKHP
jgi:hypothetical protein